MYSSTGDPRTGPDALDRPARARWGSATESEKDLDAAVAETLQPDGTTRRSDPTAVGRWVSAPADEAAGGASLSWQPSPSLLQRLLRGVSVPAAVGIIVFIVAVALTAGVMIRNLAGGSETDTIGLNPDAAVTAEVGGSPLEETEEDGAATTAAPVLVHLVGEVREPGVVELAAGARVFDAVEAAGGPTDRADLTVLNLARQISDGEQIEVFDRETAALMRETGQSLPGAGGADSLTAAGGDSGGTVNINTASAEQLTQLSGIGPALAQRIVEWREANGRFESVDQLTEVSGIGAKTLERFRDSAST